MRNAATLAPNGRATKLFRLGRPAHLLGLGKPETAETNELELERTPVRHRAMVAAGAGLATLAAVAAAVWAVRHRNHSPFEDEPALEDQPEF
jgi:hypothetical protein